MIDYRYYGLYKNPFEHNLYEAHYRRKVDLKLYSLFEEISKGENEKKAFYFLFGPEGTGKTDTLRSIHQTAYQNSINSIFLNKEESKAGEDAEKKPPIVGRRRQGTDTIRKIVSSMNKSKPSILLIDNLPTGDDTVKSIFEKIDHGMIIYSSSESGSSNSNKIGIDLFSDEEAIEVVKNRLTVSRYSKDMSPIYPFTDEIIGKLNREVDGHPATLIDRLDDVLKRGIKERIHTISEL